MVEWVKVGSGEMRPNDWQQCWVVVDGEVRLAMYNCELKADEWGDSVPEQWVFDGGPSILYETATFWAALQVPEAPC